MLSSALLGFPIEAEGLVAALVHHNLGVALPDAIVLCAFYAAATALLPLAYARIADVAPLHGVTLDIAAVGLTTASLNWIPSTGIGLGSSLMLWVFMAALAATRWINPSSRLADGISWGLGTAAFMLGVLGPLGGLSPFHLSEGLPTALMSVAGYILYGGTSAALMARRERTMDSVSCAGARHDHVLSPAAGSLEHV